MSEATAAAASASRSRTATRAPSAAIRRHVPRPMPEPPPVTTARLPSKSPTARDRRTVRIAPTPRFHRNGDTSQPPSHQRLAGPRRRQPDRRAPVCSAADLRPLSPRPLGSGPMARIDIPAGEGGDAAQVWMMRPEIAGAAGKMSEAAYHRSKLPARERGAARMRVAQLNECPIWLNFRGAAVAQQGAWERLYAHVLEYRTWPGYTDSE